MALAIAVGLFALDGIASIVMVWEATGRFSFGGSIMRVMLLIFMARGFTGIAKLRAR